LEYYLRNYIFSRGELAPFKYSTVAQFYEDRNKNRKQHVGGCKGKDKRTADIASSRSYYRKVIKPMLRAA
jgi:hypothetical protein